MVRKKIRHFHVSFALILYRNLLLGIKKNKGFIRTVRLIIKLIYDSIADNKVYCNFYQMVCIRFRHFRRAENEENIEIPPGGKTKTANNIFVICCLINLDHFIVRTDIHCKYVVQSFAKSWIPVCKGNLKTA